MKLIKLRTTFGNRLRFCLGVAMILGFFAQGLVTSANAQTERAKRPRTVSESPAAEVTIVLNEQFLNSFLDAMFTRLREPEFPLSIGRKSDDADDQSVLSAHASLRPSEGCASVIVLERERNGVKTAVHFEDGQMTAPLAFSGTYSAGLLGCLSFSGWANSVVTLEFDRERQAIMARVTVRDVELTGIPRLANSILIDLVQNSIDKRFNPYELFRADQLSPTVPIKAAGGSLRLRAKEMRPEIVPGAVRIQITYEFERVG